MVLYLTQFGKERLTCVLRHFIIQCVILPIECVLLQSSYTAARAKLSQPGILTVDSLVYFSFCFMDNRGHFDKVMCVYNVSTAAINCRINRDTNSSFTLQAVRFSTSARNVIDTTGALTTNSKLSSHAH